MSKIPATGMMDPRLIDFLDGSIGRIENRPQWLLAKAKHSQATGDILAERSEPP